MSDTFPAILLIAGIITVVALIEVLILLIPFRISLSLQIHATEAKGTFTCSWFIFGLEVLVFGKDPQLSVTVGGARLVNRPLSSFNAPEKEHTDGPGPGGVTGIISSLLRLRGPVLDAFCDLVRHTRLDYLRGTARIGLGDPGATGVMYGLYRAFIPLLPESRVNLTMVPEFNGEVCELDLTARFRITYPLLVIVNAVKIVKHPAARKVMKMMRKKPGDVAA
ncbi:MAG: DUF2953 domain-containing protein [Methanomicrobiales archaeon]|nr:DUF2953 domain-containing protein [Methanomicrobiales archaeon]